MVKILVVDDELQIRESLRTVLAAEGFEAVSVPSAAQALAAVFREPFDLVILDFVLADASGLSVLQKIREAQG
ncbi:MAG: response regulator, partial [Candidatus Omnitrophica bacterium]|nr:response regulator [Candidatus Omnitrophota bacterium]